MKDRVGKLMGREKKNNGTYTQQQMREQLNIVEKSVYFKSVQVARTERTFGMANWKRSSVNKDYAKQAVWVTDMFSLLLLDLPTTYF